MSSIAISDVTNSTTVTNGVSNGTGILDTMMNTVNLYLEDQYQRKRLLGTDYANVLLGAIQAVTAQAVQFALQEKQVEADLALKADKLLTEAKARDSVTAQIALYNRQREGFDDNVRQKLFDTQVNSWGLMFSAGMLDEKPSFITNQNVDTLYSSILGGLGS